MKERYVSASTGNDTYQGTRSKPWKTAARAYTALNDGAIGRGDRIRFKRGDVWYEPLLSSSPTLLGSVGSLVIGAYGYGERPKFVGYKTATDGAWTESTPGIWRIDLQATQADITYTGSAGVTGTGNIDVNVGFLMVDGVCKPQKRWQLTSAGPDENDLGLVNDWDWYSDNTQYLYVKHATNPGAGVEIAIRQSGTTGASYVTLDNLEFLGWGAHGINIGSGPDSMKILNCKIGWLGGTQLGADIDKTRYGNGVQFWIGASNCLTSGCEIYQCYDVAYTLQGAPTTTAVKAWAAVNFINNRVHNCSQSLEFWSKAEGGVVGTDPAAGMIDCKVTGNEFWGVGHSWGTEVRLDRTNAGVHLLSYYVELQADVEITDNTFDSARNYYSSYAFETTVFNTHDNRIYLESGQLIQAQQVQTIEEWATYVAVSNRETDSQFYVLPTALTKTADAAALTSARINRALNRETAIATGVDDVVDTLATRSFGAMTTLSSPTDATYYCKIATWSILSDYGSAETAFIFANGGEAPTITPAFGTLYCTLGGPGGSGVGTQALTIMGSPLEFSQAGAFTADCFSIVQELADTVTHTYVYTLWLRMDDEYSNMTFTPVLVNYSTDTTFELNTAPVNQLTLPSGTISAPSWGWKTSESGSDAPTTTPKYVGQEYLATTTSKWYKAKGTASSADWLLLN